MKRNCRRTEKERALHSRACALRRMTDLQLCQIADSVPETQEIIERFLKSLGTRTESGIRISDATIRKIRAVAVEQGILPAPEDE